MHYLVEPGLLRPGLVSWLFLAVVGLLLPLAALHQHGRMTAGAPSPDRLHLYASVIATHVMLLVMAWAVIREQQVNFVPAYRATPLHVVIGLLALAIGLLPLMDRFSRQDPIAKARTRLIAPRTPKEHGLFYVVCLGAGVAEELTYRAVLFTLVARVFAGGGWWIAAVITAAAFGIVHLFQGWRSAGIATLMGLREQIVIGLTGTLFIAIVVHILHDAIAGTVIAMRVRREELETGGEAVAI